MSERMRPICVLSTGRAGTSLLTRAVNLLGIDLGAEEEMLEPKVINERGFWENRSIMELNDAVLASLGGSLYMPPPLPPGWDRTPALVGARGDIAALVARTFDADRRWGFKDPRTVLTLPLWRDVVGPMDYVICVRREEEVAESLRRGGIVMEDFGQWWLDLNLLALDQTVDDRRLIVCYEDWFHDPRQVVERLALFLTGDRDVPDDAWQSIESFFEPSLRHIDLRPVGASGPTSEADAMYELLRLSAETGDHPAGRTRQLALARWLASSHGARRDLAAQAAESDALRSRCAEREARCDELEGAIADRERELADREGRLAERDRQLAERDRQLAERDGHLGERDNQLAEARERLDQLHAEVEVFARSRSWRLTAPMRIAARRLRMLRRTRR